MTTAHRPPSTNADHPTRDSDRKPSPPAKAPLPPGLTRPTSAAAGAPRAAPAPVASSAAAPSSPAVAAAEAKRAAARSAALSDDLLLAECDLGVFIAGGPGGQHRNKTESGVRLHHLPTGLRVGATERRSQFQNRAVALERLREKLRQKAATAKPRHKTRPTVSSQRRRVEAKRRQGSRKRDRKQFD